MTVIAWAAIGAASMLSFMLGLWARPFLLKLPDQQQFLDRIVNQEEAEERRNQIRRMLHDANRRTMRLDGGLPAKVHKMRRKRRMYRDPTG